MYPQNQPKTDYMGPGVWLNGGLCHTAVVVLIIYVREQ